MPTNFKYGLLSYGSPVLPSNFGLPGMGSVFWLDPTHGDDTFDGKSPQRAMKTLEAAYALLTENHNDVLFYIPGTSALTLSAAFSWAKNYCHFIGVAAPTMFGSRARIIQAAGAYEPLITISGNGCIWQNIYVFGGAASSAALTAVYLTGDWCYFESCQFVGGGCATNALDDACALSLNGSHNNVFVNCTLGAQSIAFVAGSNVLRFGSTASGQNLFRDCVIHCMNGTSVSTAYLVELTATTSVDRWLKFDRCFFYSWNQSATTMATAFLIPASPSNGKIFMQDCMGYGFDKWDASDRGMLLGNMNDVTGADTSGVAVEMVT